MAVCSSDGFAYRSRRCRNRLQGGLFGFRLRRRTYRIRRVDYSLGYLLTLFLQKRNDKAATYISDDTEEVYLFDEQFITLTQTRGDVFTSTLKARYSYIYKASEDKNYFYLYISKMQRRVIDKSSLTQGTLGEAVALLKTNLGDRFKSK